MLIQVKKNSASAHTGLFCVATKCVLMLHLVRLLLAARFRVASSQIAQKLFG
jgi:hypothetical protein